MEQNSRRCCNPLSTAKWRPAQAASREQLVTKVAVFASVSVVAAVVGRCGTFPSRALSARAGRLESSQMGEQTPVAGERPVANPAPVRERLVSQEHRTTEKAVTIGESNVPTTITLTPSTTLDLSSFTEEQRAALLSDYTRGVLDVSRRAHELQVDVGTLDQVLQSLAGTTREVSELGNSVTVTHTQATSVGRTEVLIGNTPQARRGRLSRSQKGERDMTPFYVIGGLLALSIVVAAYLIG